LPHWTLDADIVRHSYGVNATAIKYIRLFSIGLDELRRSNRNLLDLIEVDLVARVVSISAHRRGVYSTNPVTGCR